MMDYFEYQIGDVITYTRWIRPTKDCVIAFIEELRATTDIFRTYEVFFVGSIVYDWQKARDIDIILTGNLNTAHLENSLNRMYDLALNKYQLFIDARWLNDRPIELTDTTHPKTYTKIKLGYVKVTENNTVTEYDSRILEGHTRLSQYLVSHQYVYPYPKALDKLRRNVEGKLGFIRV